MLWLTFSKIFLKNVQLLKLPRNGLNVHVLRYMSVIDYAIGMSYFLHAEEQTRRPPYYGAMNNSQLRLYKMAAEKLSVALSHQSAGSMKTIFWLNVKVTHITT